MMRRLPTWSAIVSLCLLPLLWLWPCVIGQRDFVSYDVAQFPPDSFVASPARLAAAHDGNNFDVTEVPVWFLPELKFAGDELRAGRLPTWDPHARGGSVLHAHGLIGLGYPPNWLALFASDPARMLGFVAWINLALGGLLTFGLLRKLGITAFAAWFGAMLFELSGPMATNAFFWMRLSSFVWLPGVLWSVLVVAQADRWRARHVAALAGSVALAWLGGFPPFATTTTVLGAAFAAWLTIDSLRTRGVAATRPLVLRLGCGFVFGTMLAMPQVLPSLEFFPISARAVAPSWSTIQAQAFESYGLSGYLLPDAISHPADTAVLPYDKVPLALLAITREVEPGKPSDHPNYNYTEYAVFVGQLGCLLALLGALGGRGRQRGFALAAFALCAGLALFVPGVRLLFHLPVFQNVFPMRWLAPATVFVAWLAALGVERLQLATRRLPIVMAVVAAGMAVLLLWSTTRPAAWQAADPTWAVQRLADKYHTDAQGVVNFVQQPGVDRFAASFDRLAQAGDKAAWWLGGIAVWFVLLAFARDERQRRWLWLAAGTMAALQLGRHGATVTHGIVHAPAIDTEVQQFLRERAAAAHDSGGFTIVRGSLGPELPSQLPPGQLMVPGLRDLHFYSHYDGRSLQPVQALLGARGDEIAGKGYLTMALPDEIPTANGPVHVFESPLLDVLGVRYVLATQPLPHAGVRVGPHLRSASGGEFFVYERSSALPRAFTVGNVVPCRSDDEVVQRLIARDFRPRESALTLASDVPAVPPAADVPARDVHFVRDDATSIELEVAAGDARWLVLADTWLPGWTATVDGAPATIVRANHSQRLVAIPRTACRVTFTYTCPGLTAGFVLAMIAALALLVSAIATRRPNVGN